MVQGISSALSALQVLAGKIGITANNIANANTQGFKKSLATSQDLIPAGYGSNQIGRGTAGSNSLGRIVPRSLEESNVDPAEEITNMIIFRRSFQANLKVLEVENELKGDVLNIIS